MDTERRYTEQDMVIARRAGFITAWELGGSRDAIAEATMRYPMPKKVVPREVKASGYVWRIVEGELQQRPTYDGGAWYRFGMGAVEGLKDLFERPTEEVSE